MKKSTGRQAQILALAHREAQVEVDTLADMFRVSPQTIRKDLKDLAGQNHLKRIHGGAVIDTNTHNLAYLARQSIAAEAKAAIGRTTAAIIPDEVSLILNVGTSTEQVAKALVGHQKLMVITNNLNIASILLPAPSVELIVAGGIVRKTDGGITGTAAIELIHQFKVDYAIIGSSAIDSEGALLDFDYHEVKVAQAILSQARTRILVADATKFTRRAPVQIGTLEDIDIFITDRPPPEEIRSLCADKGVRCMVADPCITPVRSGCVAG